MSLLLDQQIVLVTGAGRGLGAAIAQAFAREGAHVAINYRKSREAAEALAARLGKRVRAFQADVRQPSEVTRMLSDIQIEFGAPTTPALKRRWRAVESTRTALFLSLIHI